MTDMTNTTDPTDSAAFWDRAAAKYAKRPIRDLAAYHRTLERTRAHLRPGDRALELGCGTGSTALLLAEHVADLTATDVSANMIQTARAKLQDRDVRNLRFVQAGVADVGAPGARYDVVLAFNLLHLIEDLPAALAGVAAAIEPGGLLISKTPCLAGAAWYLRPVIAAMRLAGRAPRVAFLSPAGLEQAIAAAGFAILERGDHSVSPPARFVVARKV